MTKADCFKTSHFNSTELDKWTKASRTSLVLVGKSDRKSPKPVLDTRRDQAIAKYSLYGILYLAHFLSNTVGLR